MNFLRQSTASQAKKLGPFVDDTDGATPETGLTIANTDIRLSADGGNMFAKTSGGGTHDEAGWYTVTYDATDTATVGSLQVTCKVAGALTVLAEYQVLEEAVYDKLFAAAATGVDADWTNGGRLDLILDIIAADTTTDIPALIATAQADLDIITDSDGVILGAAGVDLVWDEPLTGSSHNAATSSGRRLRQVEEAFVHANGTIATVTNGHTITLDTGAVATTDYYIGDRLQIVEGTGAGQSRVIVAYTSGRVVTLDSNFITNPDTSSLYEVVAADVHVAVSDSDLAEGFVATYTNTTTITLDAGAVATTDYYTGQQIIFTHGTGKGQATHITGYTSGRVVTMSPALITALDTTTTYHIQSVVSIAEIVDETWDESISKANHNVAQSAAKILRQGGDIAQISGSVSDVAPNTADFDTDLTQVDTFFDDSLLVFVNGAANAGIGIPIKAYLNANGNVAFESPDLWPVTPVNGDDFTIYGIHVHPVSQIADAIWDEPMAGHTTADTSGLVLNDWQDGGRLDLIQDIIAADTTTDIPALIATAQLDLDTITGSDGVFLAVSSQPAGWPANLSASAGQIIKATVDTATNSHTPTTTEFQADDITDAAADHYNGRIIVFTSGVLAGQATDITDYVLVGGIGQFTVTALTTAPLNDVTFVIV